MKYAKYLIFIIIVIWVTCFISCSEDDANPVNNSLGGLQYSGSMVLIEAQGSSFQMGSETGNADEQPVHTVSFTHDFWMDTVEVTQGDYENLMGVSYDGYFTPEWQEAYGMGDDYPVYSVSWGDAVLYCNARSRTEGLDSVYTYSDIYGFPGSLCELENVESDLSRNGYRLPTEAEWEYACRAGSNTDFFWGQEYDPYPSTSEDSTEIDDYAVWYGNSWQLGTDDPGFGNQIAGGKIQNDFGLYDMAGNVYEWCHDYYDAYTGDPQTDPAGPGSGSWNVARGGSWGTSANYLRSANRTFNSPDYLYYFLGFRCVRN